jgi:uncharacterized membrane protein
MLAANRRNLLAIFLTLLVIFEVLVYVVVTPRPQEQFFQIYLLGANHMAADYYPNNDSNIHMGESVNWYIGVVNNMGSVQLAAIRVKLGNMTISAPNDTQAAPSPAPFVTEYERFLQNNETWEFPFAWQILDTTTTQGSVHILSLQINNQTILLSEPSARNGYNFRFIFELWVWDTDAANFQFGWFATNEHRVAWLQIWFNATSAR